MRVPGRRAGIAVLVAGIALVAGTALVAVDVSLLHTASSARPAGASTASRTAEASHSGVADRAADRAGQGAAYGRFYYEPGASTTGPGQASNGAVVRSPVSLAGAAAVPSAHVHPGYATPADAVDGFYQALLGGAPAQACAYATNPCPSPGSGRITGQVSIVDAVSDGAEALVEITGTICRSVTCVPLTDRVVMPTGPASFGLSWSSLTSGVYGWAGSPLPCVRDQATGQWHVKLS
jgi:hypothetical protein